MRTNAELRERMAVVANDIEAVERVLDSLGHQGEAVTTPRAARMSCTIAMSFGSTC